MYEIEKNINTVSLEEELKNHTQPQIDTSFLLAESFVKRNYLNDIARYEVNPLTRSVQEEILCNTTQMFKVSGLVFNKDENTMDKLNNVYSALHSLNMTLVLLISSKGTDVDFYIGVKAKKGLEMDDEMGDAFQKTFLGNFPGSDIKKVNMDSFIKNFEYSLPKDGNNAVTSLTSIPALKTKETKIHNVEFTQGIEKFIDTMKGKTFSVLIISDPISNNQLAWTRQGYEELYSEFYPFSELEASVGKEFSKTVTNADVEGVTLAIGKSISKTQSFTNARSKGINNSNNKNAGINIIVASYQGGKQIGLSQTDSESVQQGEQRSRQESSSALKQRSTQKGETQADTSSSTIKFTNKAVKDLLNTIEEHLKRIKDCENYGMWANAVYFIAPNKEDTIIAASAFKGIIDGDSTGLETSCINTWFKEKRVKTINDYLRHMEHPRFHDPDYLYNTEAATDLNLTTMLSTKELTIQCGIPYKSITGVAVREMAEFGRNIYSSTAKTDNKIVLGNIYHMGQVETNSLVELDIERLREHTFITGSTGSGKSNAIYGLISKIWDNYNIPTLVIEPAKGEYKQIFHDKFNVFGTNPKYTELLRINPFKFDKEIHVLEHIDRLIDIFNVCWPMYAAMPAVLKEAVERAYISAGWNLDTSENSVNENLYPNFNDLLRALRQVISHSDYSQEVKDNYTGSLITRVKSLTNGLNGRIFSGDEIDNNILFESNTIVDLSRVGSSETKAMLMGILIMRLQERRMAQDGINLKLKHLTVLEEAHHILKKTSTEQSSEFANLLGKSVEMIGNAIAEMRTAGEGFVIADQAPGLLDMSVIRNTNTKIILRLPDETDRELVGKAAGLNDDQIVELAKIPTGVAAVYQNKWVEPVLCQIEECKLKPVEYAGPKKILEKPSDNLVRDEILQYVLSGISGEKPEKDVEYLKIRLLGSNLPSEIRGTLLNLLEDKLPTTIDDVSRKIASCFDNQDCLFADSKKAQNVEEWNSMLKGGLQFVMPSMSQTCQNNILECIIKEKAVENPRDVEKYSMWKELMGKDVIS